MDLDIKRVLAARPGEPQKVELNALTTPWGEKLDPQHVLDEYPRPRLRRAAWTNLNGWWDYAIVECSAARSLWHCARPPQGWDGRILVPFSPEASLSGVGRQLLPTQLLWYHRTMEVGKLAPNKRLLLHFGAVDYACACYVNGTRVATHVGCYTAFTADVTDAVAPGRNVIELCVYDPSEQGTQLRGKQRLARGNMWYTAQSGIWQTVWAEEVPSCRIQSIQVCPQADTGRLLLGIQLSEAGERLGVEVLDAAGTVVASASAKPDDKIAELSLKVADPHLWEPDDPYLYAVRLTYGQDAADSYVAFRTVSVEADEQGMPRFFLNHRPLFLRGLLDQGYWPDGLMTPPSDEAMVADIEAARAGGFNTLRKHIKVEPERWYWHCDRLGMLVIQDMVSGGGVPGVWPSANIPTLVRRSWAAVSDVKPRSWARLGAGDAAYREEWEATARTTVRKLAFHPCIVTWVVFNESWGQFQSASMTQRLREVDDTRPYIATSGWYDQGAGDFFAVHNYFRGMNVYKDPHARRGVPRTRAFIMDEFGGLTCPVEGHTSVDTVYGYDTYEDVESWRCALRRLLDEVSSLEDQGLCGFVYTQLTDVEEETNGLLTYDRRVNKLEA